MRRSRDDASFPVRVWEKRHARPAADPCSVRDDLREHPRRGSRVRSNLVCLTEDRLLAERQGAKNFLEGIQRNPNRMRE